jgi:hypothetical protein
MIFGRQSHGDGEVPTALQLLDLIAARLQKSDNAFGPTICAAPVTTK